MAIPKFSSKDPEEIVELGFEFANIIETGETISSASFDVSVLAGTDATPAAMLSGAVIIEGTVVSQKIIGGVDGCTYRIECTANTSANNKYIETGSIKVTEKNA